MGNQQFVILPHPSINIGFIPAWRNNDQIIIILVAQRALVSLLGPSPQALPVVQLSAAGSPQPPWSPRHQQLSGTSSPWPPSSVHATEMVGFKAGQKPHHLEMLLTMSPHQMGKVTLPPPNLASWSMGHDGVSPTFHGQFVHQVVAAPGRMEEDLGAFLWQIPAPLCLAVTFPGSKGTSPVSSCTNKVRKYFLHPRSWFC